MRLNRYLSQCGIASRRGAEEIILGGRVSINGHLITELATKVLPEDKVVVDGSPVRAEAPVVLVLNKPKGYLCSRGDKHERMTIYDLLPLKYQNLHHVGRLDKESEGLILLTNRGDLSHRIIHPSQGAEKEYEVVVDQALNQGIMAKLVKGMMTEEGFARAERTWMDGDYRAHIVLKMGLKRQIRMMLYYLGYEVTRLTRIRIGWLKLHGLSKGAYKELTPTEVERFFKEEPAKPKLERKPAEEKDDGIEDHRPLSRRAPKREGSSETREPRGFKPTGGKKSGAPARFSEEKPIRGKKSPSSRSSEGKPTRGKKSGSASWSSSSDDKPSYSKPKSKTFSPRSRSSETGRDEKPRGRSGPPTRHQAPRGPRRGPPSR
ncbi:pseudouridine synthase [Prosthecobacter sp.]|uniref:pseudouridine synthase n=1 Tax=Prosthecobacter sp. TaxID=1965333 RepID=UPI002489AB20|nr:pseudouridine synthase [Prosthecobacter sp.]MDI1313983.1 pseudouridine synthase [Prosthecobacter sp.]